MNFREKGRFPTRSYPYRERAEGAFDADPASAVEFKSGKLYQFILGRDRIPVVIGKSAFRELNDPFSILLLKRGTFPLTLRRFLSDLDQFNSTPEGLPAQKTFLVADGGQIPWSQSTASLNRQFRMVVTRAHNDQVDIMISTSTVFDSDTNFLQVIGWDSKKEAYNFYERRGGAWVWAGDSYNALRPPTRGKGPFDSHVNGAMVMKELKLPWNNWHSMSAGIQDIVFEPGDPLLHETLFKSKVSAHELEVSVVKPGVRRWNLARFNKASRNSGHLEDVPLFLRQILASTTVNLVSSEQQSSQITATSELVLPTSFFFNSDALMDICELDPNISPVKSSGKYYLDSLKKYEFRLSQPESGFEQRGDSFFAFLVPEPAFEDLDVLSLLVQKRIISKKMAACMLIIDFQNPLISSTRASLLKYVPEVVKLPNTSTASNFEDLFVGAVRAAAAQSSQGTPEREFLTNWNLAEGVWQSTFASRIEQYFGELNKVAQTAKGFNDWVLLAESLRRDFATRPLNEFKFLTIPLTNIPRNGPPRRMNINGTIT